MRKGSLILLLAVVLLAGMVSGCEEDSGMAAFSSAISEACGGHVETWSFEVKGKNLLGREQVKIVTVEVTKTCFLGIPAGYKAKWGFFGIEEEGAKDLGTLYGIVSRKILGQ